MPEIGHAMKANVLMEIRLATGNIATSGKSHIHCNSAIRALHAEGMAFSRGMANGTNSRIKILLRMHSCLFAAIRSHSLFREHGHLDAVDCLYCEIVITPWQFAQGHQTSGLLEITSNKSSIRFNCALCTTLHLPGGCVMCLWTPFFSSSESLSRNQGEGVC